MGRKKGRRSSGKKNRVNAGVPTGGQFANKRTSESETELVTKVHTTTPDNGVAANDDGWEYNPPSNKPAKDVSEEDSKQKQSFVLNDFEPKDRLKAVSLLGIANAHDIPLKDVLQYAKDNNLSNPTDVNRSLNAKNETQFSYTEGFDPKPPNYNRSSPVTRHSYQPTSSPVVTTKQRAEDIKSLSERIKVCESCGASFISDEPGVCITCEISNIEADPDDNLSDSYDLDEIEISACSSCGTLLLDDEVEGVGLCESCEREYESVLGEDGNWRDMVKDGNFNS